MTIELGFRLKSEPMVTETKKKAYTLRSINGILRWLLSIFFLDFIYLLQANTHGYVLACLTLPTPLAGALKDVHEICRIDKQNGADDRISVDAVWNCFSDSKRSCGCENQRKMKREKSAR